MDRPLRLAVLISGGGTTLQNFMDRIASGKLNVEIVRVISNKPDAFGLIRARQAGIATAVFERKKAASREEFSRRIFDECRAAGADLVCLAGFLQLIVIPDDFRWRVMNVHPSLIPAFCGQGYFGHHVHEALLTFGSKVSGCTVHFADNQYDHGPIIAQEAVSVLENDTPETLAARVFEKECELYPRAVMWFAEGRLRVEGRRVHVVEPGAK